MEDSAKNIRKGILESHHAPMKNSPWMKKDGKKWGEKAKWF
jgi:hypothetical protein